MHIPDNCHAIRDTDLCTVLQTAPPVQRAALLPGADGHAARTREKERRPTSLQTLRTVQEPSSPTAARP